MIIGFVGSQLYSVLSRVLVRLEVDDPLESCLVFGLQGLWGSLSVGLFDRHQGLIYTRDADLFLI